MTLHRQLADKTYRHGKYFAFQITDPKQRRIHKAQVADRLLHHALYRMMYPYFDRKFIFDSFSCRKKKGTHAALNRFRTMARRASRNHTRTVWVLKCDIKQFFASVNHEVLLELLARDIEDPDLFWLLEQVIQSFHTAGRPGTGLPLGNLTSQLFINMYMNEFDHFVKRTLKVQHYIRYADDFVLLSTEK